jgi:hypothetical protein
MGECKASLQTSSVWAMHACLQWRAGVVMQSDAGVCEKDAVGDKERDG